MKFRFLALLVLGVFTVPPRHLQAQTTLAAQVVVNPQNELRVVPQSLFGTNTEWIWNENLLWDQNLQAADSRYLGLVKALKPSLIRFPGGLLADYYDWRNGVGPLSGRPTMPILPGGPLSLNNFGTAEAQALAGAAGSHLLITVNAGTGTAQMAADWVRYVNSGSVGPRVDYWEIGNELYLPTSVGNMTVVSLPVADYAARVVEFAKAMKAVDPAIKVGAIIPENYNQAPPSPWTQTVVATTADYIDFVAVHNAYAPVMPPVVTQDVATVYRGLLAAPLAIQKNLDAIAAAVDQLAPQRAGQISVAVTEWGPLFSGDLSHPFVDHVKTLGSGLYTASTLMAMIRSPRTTVANAFKLNDTLFMGSIGLKGTAPAPTPSYFAFQIFTTHLGSILVDSRTVSPTYDSTWVGGIPAMSQVPLLDVIVTLGPDRKSCYVTAVNKSFDQAINATINLGSLIAAGTSTSWTLKGTALDANTGTGPYPGITIGPQALLTPVSRFYYGSTTEVQLTSGSVSLTGNVFSYKFPAASVTSLKIPVK